MQKDFPLSLGSLISEMNEADFALKDLYSAYTSTRDINAIIRSISKTNETLEKAVIASRNVLERLYNNGAFPENDKPTPPDMSISGKARVMYDGWLHIKLNALLPHCRYQTPKYLTDTIVRLVDGLSRERGGLPYYNNAMLIIDEHCDIKNRSVYDQDNKGWKAVLNAMKGNLFPDDDQFSLGIALLSSMDVIPSCSIYVMDISDAGNFFDMRLNGSLDH